MTGGSFYAGRSTRVPKFGEFSGLLHVTEVPGNTGAKGPAGTLLTIDTMGGRSPPYPLCTGRCDETVDRFRSQLGKYPFAVRTLVKLALARSRIYFTS